MFWEAQEKLNLNLDRAYLNENRSFYGRFFIPFYPKVVKGYNQNGGFDTDSRPL